jgi:hypothetical protein
VSLALHEELLRQGPRVADEPAAADELSKRLVRDVSAVPTFARIAAGAVVLLEVARHLGGAIGALAWLAVAAMFFAEWLRSWIQGLEERR